MLSFCRFKHKKTIEKLRSGRDISLRIQVVNSRMVCSFLLSLWFGIRICELQRGLLMEVLVSSPTLSLVRSPIRPSVLESVMSWAMAAVDLLMETVVLLLVSLSFACVQASGRACHANMKGHIVPHSCSSHSYLRSKLEARTR